MFKIIFCLILHINLEQFNFSVTFVTINHATFIRLCNLLEIDETIKQENV